MRLFRCVLYTTITDSRKGLWCHLQETSYVNHRSTKDNLRFLAQEAFITLRGILESLTVGMLLRTDSNMLQDLAIKHVYLLIANKQVVEVIIRNGIQLGIL